ncbi:MAG: hypothetical protein IPK13_07350 [Deltaproteobacteria bacterium]|nr:hypothetical protein [Deltaproteobacteria bacterium]
MGSDVRQTDDGFEAHIELDGFERWVACSSLMDAEALSRLGELTRAYVDLLRSDAEQRTPPELELVDDLIQGFELAREALLRVGYELVASMVDSKLIWLRQARERVLAS